MDREHLWHGNRRDFLKFSAGVAATAAVSSIPDNLVSHYEPVIEETPPEETLEDIVNQIKEFEENFGDKEVSFEDAREYIPLVAKLFVKATGSSKTAEELAANTYIIRGRKREPRDVISFNLTGKVDDPFSYEEVQHFQEDYPEVYMSESLAQSIAVHAGDIGGMVTHGKTFLVIGDSSPDATRGFEQQYNGSGIYVECQEPKPIVTMRHRLLHEFTHAEAMKGWQPLEEDVFEALKSTGFHFGDREKLDSPFKQNFIAGYYIHFSEQVVDSQGFTAFNEFITDYLASRISVENGLEYVTPIYDTPDTAYKFDLLLSQIGMGVKELRTLYRNSDLKEFLLKVANGAQNIQFENDQDRMKFALETVGFLEPHPFYGLPESFQPYFPQIPSDFYEYMDPQMYKQFRPRDPDMNLLGCMY